MERAIYLWAQQIAEAQEELPLVQLENDSDTYFDTPGHHLAYFYAEGERYGYLRHERVGSEPYVKWSKINNPEELAGDPLTQVRLHNGEYIYRRECGHKDLEVINLEMHLSQACDVSIAATM